MTRLIFILLSLSFSAFLNAQDHHSDDPNHDHANHDHFHTNEFGISVAPVIFSGSDEVFVGLHSHYIRRLGQSPFGIGLGAEFIFNEARHQTYGLVFQYTPVDKLHLVASPGLAIENEAEAHEGEEHSTEEMHGTEIVFALHLEAFYEFHLGIIDLGPSFEYAWDPHDVHFALGLHVALPF